MHGILHGSPQLNGRRGERRERKCSFGSLRLYICMHTSKHHGPTMVQYEEDRETIKVGFLFLHVPIVVRCVSQKRTNASTSPVCFAQ